MVALAWASAASTGRARRRPPSPAEAARAATEQAGPIPARRAPLMGSGQTPVPPHAFEVLLEG